MYELAYNMYMYMYSTCMYCIGTKLVSMHLVSVMFHIGHAVSSCFVVTMLMNISICVCMLSTCMAFYILPIRSPEEMSGESTSQVLKYCLSVYIYIYIAV